MCAATRRPELAPCYLASRSQKLARELSLINQIDGDKIGQRLAACLEALGDDRLLRSSETDVRHAESVW